jgi:hypothetical protein
MRPAARRLMPVLAGWLSAWLWATGPVWTLGWTAEPATSSPEAAEPPAAMAEKPAAVEQVVLRDPGGERLVEGTVVVEAVDGGLLLELADLRYQLVQPREIVARRTVDAARADESPRDLGRRILAELPPGFQLHLTRRYVVCFDTSRDYARWAAALFERLHEAFHAFWRNAGIELQEPDRPLVVLVFSRRDDYEQYAARDLGAAADRIAGYYNLMSNRVATYDITGSDGLPRPPGRGQARGVDVLARPEAAGLVSTLVHEATHQVAFNCGLHRRLAPVPVWVSEGIATYFETPDLRSTNGWRGIGRVNRHRLDRFRRTYRPGDLEALVAGDERFRDLSQAADAYAAAWALTWFLIETRKDQFAEYMRTMASKPPLSADSREQRLRDFQAAFGLSPPELEPAFLRHTARLESRKP